MGTIPTIPTFTAGAVLTAAQLNNMKAVSDFWALTPRCSAYPTAAQSVTTNAWLSIALTAEVYDIVQSGDAASHDNATNNSRIYARTTGKYEVTGQVAFVSNATGYRMARVLQNGSTVLIESHQSAVSGVSTSVPIPPVEFALTAGDYIEMQGYQTTGGALDTLQGVRNTFLRMKLTGS